MAVDIVLIIFGVVTFEKAVGVTTVGEVFQITKQGGIKRFSAFSSIDRAAIALRDARYILM